MLAGIRRTYRVQIAGGRMISGGGPNGDRDLRGIP
jgi:hypothetical protein